MFRPPSHLIVDETDHWLVNQRVDSSLPGYFMVVSKATATNLYDLPDYALSELGIHLARLQRILTGLFDPSHFYIGRCGRIPGISVYFHVIPIYDWVERAFAQDPRYGVLREFNLPCESNALGNENPSERDMTTFVWREFCECQNPPNIMGPSVQATVDLVKTLLKTSLPPSRLRRSFERGHP